MGQAHAGSVLIIHLIFSRLQFCALSVILAIAQFIVVIAIFTLLRPEFIRYPLGGIPVYPQDQFVNGAVEDLKDFGKTFVEGLVQMLRFGTDRRS